MSYNLIPKELWDMPLNEINAEYRGRDTQSLFCWNRVRKNKGIANLTFNTLPDFYKSNFYWRCYSPKNKI